MRSLLFITSGFRNATLFNMKLILNILFILIVPWFAQANPLAKNAYTDLRGTIDGRKIRMTLYCFANNDLAGHYYFVDNNSVDKKITLRGTLIHQQITLKGYNNSNGTEGKLVETFTGTKEQYKDFTGVCVNISDKKKRVFSLKVNTVLEAVDFGKRYKGFSLYDEQVEAFMKQIKTAILTQNQDFLAKVIAYPIKVKIKNRLRTIENARIFKKRYAYIFTDEVVQQVKKAIPYDLFVRNSQVMLGNGCIWVQERYGILKIIVVNN